jgi:hypothetical protein
MNVIAKETQTTNDFEQLKTRLKGPAGACPRWSLLLLELSAKEVVYLAPAYGCSKSTFVQPGP